MSPRASTTPSRKEDQGPGNKRNVEGKTSPEYNPLRGVGTKVSSTVEGAIRSSKVPKGLAESQFVRDIVEHLMLVFSRSGRRQKGGVPDTATPLELRNATGSVALPLSLRHPGVLGPQTLGLSALAFVATDFTASFKTNPTRGSWRSRLLASARRLEEHILPRLRLNMESLLLFLETAGYKPEDPKEDWIIRRVDTFGSFLLQDRYEPYMKYIAADVQARGLDSSQTDPDNVATRPPRPSWLHESETHFLGGSAYAWFATRTNREAEDRALALSLLNQITGLKKRQSVIPLERVHLATGTWFGSIFGARDPAPPAKPAEPSQLDANGEVNNSTPSVIQDVFQKTCDETVRFLLKRGASDPKAAEIGVPGTKARFELSASRSYGGTLGFCHEAMMEHAVHIGLFMQELGIREDLATCTNAVEANFVAPHGTFSVSKFTQDGYVETSRLRLASLVANSTVQDLLSFTGNDTDVSPVGLPEPQKVRMISKGRALIAYQVKALQTFMARLILGLSSFLLTREREGRRDEEILSIVVSAVLGKYEFFVSGDYTAATDSLAPWASEAVARSICRLAGLHPLVEKLLFVTLTGHTISPATLESFGDLLDVEAIRKILGPLNENGVWSQTWGQLMGSPTSFPILCLVNFVITLIAKRESLSQTSGCTMRVARRSIPVSKTGIVINGDDIGFVATRHLYAHWTKLTTMVGLSPSVGKNFFSKEFLQVNSRMFVPVPGVSNKDDGWQFADRKPRFQLVHTPSLAVLAPPRTVSFSEFCLSAPSWQRTFLGPTSGFERKRLNRLWHSVWMPQLSSLPTGLMNWYIPRQLGGFGLEPSDDDWSVNGSQGAAAAFLRDHVTPESYRLASLKWDQPLATTSVWQDTDKVMKELVANGLVTFDFVPNGVKPISIPQLPLGGILSGYSSQIDKPPKIDAPVDVRRLLTVPLYRSRGKTRVLPGWSFSPTSWDQTCASTAITMTTRKLVEQQRAAPSPMTWLRDSIRALRKASSKTGRSMDKDQIVKWEDREADYLCTPGVTFAPASLTFDLTSARINGLERLGPATTTWNHLLSGNTFLQGSQSGSEMALISDIPDPGSFISYSATADTWT